MKSLRLTIGFLFSAFVLNLSIANAATIDPVTGLSGSVSVTNATPGTGFFLPVDTVAGMAGNTATITVATDGYIDFSIRDAGVRGDAFALQLDGSTLTPDGGNLGANTRGVGATDFFSMFINNIFLTAGSHTFGIFYTDSCCTVITANSFEFSSFRPVSDVPLPAALPLFLAGLGGLSFFRRRKTA